MKSAVAIITYNRESALKDCLEGINKHCSQYPIAIFEDAGARDSTVRNLTQPSNLSEGSEVIKSSTYLSDIYTLANGTKLFAGAANLGVAGNSNRALKWFMEETDADHLCLLNDDLYVYGDFVDFYQKAHTDLEVGLFCFCDFKSDAYRFFPLHSRGYRLKNLTRMTGIMMSLTRAAVEKIGYFDVDFGPFGEEHCDWTNRARFEGLINIDDTPMQCLDLVQPEPPLLAHQEVETSVTGGYREKCNKIALSAMQQASLRYRVESHYRPYRLKQRTFVGAYGGGGIPEAHLTHLPMVDGSRF